MLLVSSVLVCTAVAGALAWTDTPTYTARTQLSVSARGLEGKPAQALEGGLYAKQRARSYAKIIASPRGAQTVIEQLGLAEDVHGVQDKIQASAPPGSTLINVTVRDRSPGLAESIADSLADQVVGLAKDLERPDGGRRSPVQVTVERPAQLPANPVSPQKPIYLVLGVLFGLVFGVGGAALRSSLDHRIRSDSDASVTAGAPVLGRVAEHPDRGKSPLMAGDPPSAGAEGYRRLRANLRALSAEDELRSLVVSSAVPGEGKTEVVANLGVSLAQAGERVVVVDANLRSPRLGELLGVRSSIGLTDLLESRRPIELPLRRHPTAPVEFLASGSPRPNPSDLLESEALDRVLRMLTDRFDFVIVDTPALLPVADAAILARRASGVILVARAASTGTDELQAARQSLRAVNAKVVGVVLNGVRERDSRLYREDPLPPRRGRSHLLAPIRSDGQGSLKWLH
jgi:succinoglycan biosynthesis transport protein ExoP